MIDLIFSIIIYLMVVEDKSLQNFNIILLKINTTEIQ